MNKPKTYQIPSDFPHCATQGAVTGAQEKLLLSEFENKFYPPGCTPPELYERWEACEDLAQQFSQKSLESKAGKRSHMTEQEILKQYYDRLLQKRWAANDEIAWIIRRAASILGWPSPI